MTDPTPTPPESPAEPPKPKWWDRVLLSGTPLERGAMSAAKKALALFADQTGRKVRFLFSVRDARNIRHYLDAVEQAYIDRDRRLQRGTALFQEAVDQLAHEHEMHRRAVEALTTLRLAADIYCHTVAARCTKPRWRSVVPYAAAERRAFDHLAAALEGAQGWFPPDRPPALAPVTDPEPAAARPAEVSA